MENKPYASDVLPALIASVSAYLAQHLTVGELTVLSTLLGSLAGDLGTIAALRAVKREPEERTLPDFIPPTL